jgi:hypothetical protein
MADDAVAGVQKQGTTESGIPQLNRRPGGWTPVRTPQDLVERFQQHPELEQAIKKDPTIVAAVITPLDSDTWIYRIVVSALGLAVLGSIGGAVYLAGQSPGATTPEGIVAIGSAAVGALAGLLAPSPARAGRQ